MATRIRELDKIDRKILRILQAEGRISFTELGERVGLSTTPCTERVRRLEREGVITGYHAHLDPAAVKASLLVFVEISGVQIRRHLRGVPARRAEAAQRTGMPSCIGRLRLPAEGADQRDGLLPQAARQHAADTAACT